MKRTKTTEILIEVETIRVTKKRSVPPRPAEARKKVSSETDSCANAFAKNGGRFEHLFGKLF